jgi:hypothetical protein
MNEAPPTTSWAVAMGLLTLREFHSVNELDQQTIERAVRNMLDRYGQAFLDGEQKVFRSDCAFFWGVRLEEYGDEEA